jgi:hypothetical protein
MESAFAALAFLLGHCWETTLPEGAVDTHCFAEVKPGALVRDRHAVRKDGQVVYTGETDFTLKDGRLHFHYVGSTGADLAGPIHVEGKRIVFDDTDDTGTTTFWRSLDADHFEDVTEAPAELKELAGRKLYTRVERSSP